MTIRYNTLFIFGLLSATMSPLISLGFTVVRLHDVVFPLVLLDALSFGRLFRKSASGFLFLGIVFFMAVSILYGYFFLEVKGEIHDIVRLPRVITFWAAYYVGSRVRIDKRFNAVLINTMFLIIAFYAVLVIIQLLNISPLVEISSEIYRTDLGVDDFSLTRMHRRPSGAMGNPNSAAFIYIMMACFAFSNIFSGERYLGKQRMKIVFMAIIAVLLVLVSQSRTGLVMLVTALGYFLIRNYREYGKKHYIAVCLIILVMSVGYFYHADSRDRVSRIFVDTRPGRINAVMIRLSCWLPAFTKIKYSPILGWGPQKYYTIKVEREESNEKAPRDFWGNVFYSQDRIRQDPVWPVWPHNGLLNIWVRFGLVGLVLVLFLYWRAWRSSSVPFHGPKMSMAEWFFKRSCRGFFWSLIVIVSTVGFWTTANLGFIACLFFGALSSFSKNRVGEEDLSTCRTKKFA